MDQDHTASFISALANLHPAGGEADELASLDGWGVDQLKAEVVRLRRAIAAAGVNVALIPGSLPGMGGVGVGVNVGQVPQVPQVEMERLEQGELMGLPGYPFSLSSADPGPSHQHQHSHGQQHSHTQPQPHPQSQQPPPQPPPRRGVKREAAAMGARKKHAPHDLETGKRVERGRRVELQRAIRAKMRYMMGIGLEDDLPPPSQDGNVAAPGWVPNWATGIGDPRNSAWIDRVVDSFITSVTTYHEWSKVPPEDLDQDTVRNGVRTAFQNFAKRYLAEVDPQQAKKKQKYIKNRRRWARKDLKRRAKAIMDPTFADVHLPAAALHIDYMSSEYSSAGEDESDEGDLGLSRRAHWAEMLSHKPPMPEGGKGGWAEGVSEKVLEVRTPTWRSARLDEVYRQLDTISAAQAAARATPASQQASSSIKSRSNPRLGHVAPSHKRFTMPPALMRRGHVPRDAGETWMWASGAVGVWPDIVPMGMEMGMMEGNDARAAVAAAVRAAEEERDLEGNEGEMGVDALVVRWTEAE